MKKHHNLLAILAVILMLVFWLTVHSVFRHSENLHKTFQNAQDSIKSDTLTKKEPLIIK